jgi:hypothetical protein
VREGVDQQVITTEESAGFSVTGGVGSSFGKASWPLAELEVFLHAIKLSCLGEEFVFPRESIVSLSRYRGLFSVGIRIRHSVPLYPNFVIFWVCLVFQRTRFKRFKERVEAFGYEVK